jgi:hypothetical protein
MRSLLAAFLLLLQLGPTVALGLCIAGAPRESVERDCPMSQSAVTRQGAAGVEKSRAADVLAVEASRGPYCCSVDDLCMLSTIAIISPRPALTVVEVPCCVTLSWSTTFLIREPTAPPSPPPNS